MIAYFLSVTICWAVCMALYAALLHREKFFRLNRAYLLSTLVLGLLIPALKWQTPQPVWLSEAVLLPVATIGEAVTGAMTSAAAQPVSVFLAIYLLGAGWMGFRFFRNLLRLWALARSGRLIRRPGYYLVENERVKAPYSFLGFLFWNPVFDRDPETAHTIRAHEIAHIRQGHSVDLLFVEMLLIVFWWNPFLHAYGRALRNVHEYLADAEAIRQTTARDYGQLLIRQCLSQTTPALAHGLRNHSQLKNRIVMMTKSHSPRLALVKYLALLPLLAFLTASFAQVKSGPALTEADQMPVFGVCDGNLKGDALIACSNANMMQYLMENLRYPAKARKDGVEGMVVASFVVTSKGKVDRVAIKKQVSPECDAEVIRLLQEMPKWKPGKKGKKAVDVELTLPVRFKLSE